MPFFEPQSRAHPPRLPGNLLGLAQARRRRWQTALIHLHAQRQRRRHRSPPQLVSEYTVPTSSPASGSARAVWGMHVRAPMHGVVDGSGLDFPVRARQQQDLVPLAKNSGRRTRKLRCAPARGRGSVVGLQSEASESELADVPLKTKKTCNRSRTHRAPVTRLLRPRVVAIADFVAWLADHGGKGLRQMPE